MQNDNTLWTSWTLSDLPRALRRLRTVLPLLGVLLSPSELFANQPPQVQVLSPAGDISISGAQNTVAFNGTASDPENQLKRVEYRVNGGQWLSASGTEVWSFSAGGLLSGQSNLIQVRAVDMLDQSGNPVSRSVFRQSSERPAVTVLEPAGDVTVPSTQSEIDFRGTAADADGTIRRVEVRLNGGEWQPAEGTSSWRYRVTGLQPSGNSVSVRAFDDQGNDSPEVRRTVIRSLGSIRPRLTVLEPAGDRSLPSGQSSLAFNGTAADADGSVARVEYQINGGPWRLASGRENWSFTADGLVDGGNIVLVRALDQQDLTSDPVGRILRPEAAVGAPTLSITEPASDRALSGLATALRFSGVAGGGGIERVEYRLNQGGWVSAQGRDSWSFTIDNWNAGRNVVQVRALDRDGLFSAASTREITVDPAGGGGVLFRDHFEAG